MKKHNLSITVGIPTYYGGPGLVRTVKSVLNSRGLEKFRLMVTVDGNPLEEKIDEQIKELGVEVIDNKDRRGQMGRIKQMIKLVRTDLLVIAQDDVKVAPATLAKVVEVFTEDPKLTMVSVKLVSLPAKTLLERFIEVGIRINHRIGQAWRQGDNYLGSTGRCLAFRSKLAKKFKIAEEVINSDAYLYFENQRLGGKFRYLPEAVAYIKSPQRLDEFLKQSRKFQMSRQENTHYLKKDLSSEYAIPKGIALRVVVEEFIERPILTAGYLFLFGYTRLAGRNLFINSSRFWETDLSTKQV